MDKQIDIASILDWYIFAGVTETCADEPCIKNMDVLPTNKAETSVSQEKIITKKATTIESASVLPVNSYVINATDLCNNAQSLDELEKILLNFEGCPSLKKMAASTILGDGNAKAKVMLVGEAPGADEDRIGKPFVGKCGKLLDKMLSAIKFERADCYITNVLPWRPPGNRTPTDSEIAVCLPFLKRQIELIEPDFLFLLGGLSLKSVMNIEDSISRSRGKWMEYLLPNGKKIQVLATYHPSYLLRSSAQKSKVWTDLLRLKTKFEEMK